MVKFLFNKIIRNKLTQVMGDEGVKVNQVILSDEEYYTELLAKLDEETDEVIKSEDYSELIEELADLSTVIDAICALKNINLEQIESAKKAKIDHKGDFSQKIRIDHVEFDENDAKFKYYLDYYLNDPKKYPEIK